MFTYHCNKNAMDVIEVSDLLNKTLKIKNCNLSLSDYLIAITILKAAPTFNFLKSLMHLELKKYQSKSDTFSIKMDENDNRLAFKKMSEESVSIISIILK